MFVEHKVFFDLHIILHNSNITFENWVIHTLSFSCLYELPSDMLLETGSCFSVVCVIIKCPVVGQGKAASESIVSFGQFWFDVKTPANHGRMTPHAGLILKLAKLQLLFKQDALEWVSRKGLQFRLTLLQNRGHVTAILGCHCFPFSCNNFSSCHLHVSYFLLQVIHFPFQQLFWFLLAHTAFLLFWKNWAEHLPCFISGDGGGRPSSVMSLGVTSVGGHSHGHPASPIDVGSSWEDIDPRSPEPLVVRGGWLWLIWVVRWTT